MPRHAVTSADIVEIEALGDEIVADLLALLPSEQRDAVTAHVLEEVSYEELARTAGVTSSAIRHRVSRGLRTLRDHLGVDQ